MTLYQYLLDLYNSELEWSGLPRISCVDIHDAAWTFEHTISPLTEQDYCDFTVERSYRDRNSVTFVYHTGNMGIEYTIQGWE